MYGSPKLGFLIVFLPFFCSCLRTYQVPGEDGRRRGRGGRLGSGSPGLEVGVGESGGAGLGGEGDGSGLGLGSGSGLGWAGLGSG